jgi:hypothetical protein
MIICLILIVIFFDNLHLITSFGKEKEITSQNTFFNMTDLNSQYDMSNIPDDVLNESSNNYETILKVMASRKYRSCKASALFNPRKNKYYIRNPTIWKSVGGKGSLKEYITLKCESVPSRINSNLQKFYFSFKQVEEILYNNEDSILNDAIHEITDIRNGIEMTLFPVKFYKALPLNNYSNQKDLLCYDSVKVLGIDKNNNDYLILSALNKNKIVYCNGYDVSMQYNMNNFIRYSSYCDEFCAEDFIYFSVDLIKCKCDFFSYVDDLKKNKNFINANNSTDGCPYSRRLDRYEIFANPNEISEKMTKQDDQNKSYQRYYLHFIIILFTFQILYCFYFTTKNNIFIKFTIFFYISVAIIFYIPQRIKYENLTRIDFGKIFELISDLYPIPILIFLSCDSSAKQYDILKLSYMILNNSLEYILRETKINEIELIFRFFLILFSILIKNGLDTWGATMTCFNLSVVLKNIFEFMSRFSLYLVENNILTDITVPIFIILGRPGEFFMMSDHLLFQANYLKLKPNFDKIYENWFLEALNFHKFKNIIIFLKFSRYYFIIMIIACFNKQHTPKKMLNYLVDFKFKKMITYFINLSYYNLFNLNSKNDTNSVFNKIFMIPITISLYLCNVVLTKDGFKILCFHFIIGAFYVFLSDWKEHKIKKRNVSSNIRNSSTIHNILQNEGRGLQEVIRNNFDNGDEFIR